MRPLPINERGYAVDVLTDVVHARHADHARGLPRTATSDGVRQHLLGRTPVPCTVCWPLPEKATKAKGRSTRDAEAEVYVPTDDGVIHPAVPEPIAPPIDEVPTE